MCVALFLHIIEELMLVIRVWVEDVCIMCLEVRNCLHSSIKRQFFVDK